MNIELHDKTLKEFRLSLIQEGRNAFCFEEAYKAHGGNIMATRKVLYRLINAKELFSPKKDFFVIVPPEFQNSGSVPTLWFIDAYMNSIHCPYYIGLLSAAALLGAAHQQPQVLQVLLPKQIRSIRKNDTYIQFYTSQNIEKEYLQKHKTAYGYVSISSPELTLLDLFRFPGAAGYWNNIATVMFELADQIKIRELKRLINHHEPLSHIQRLGYISEQIGVNKIATLCEALLKKKPPLFVSLLNPYLKNNEVTEVNSKWRLKINDMIETDI